MVSFKINGTDYSYDGDGDMPLLWYLREELGLVGAKFGCGIGDCGACTVIIDDMATRSCILQMQDADGLNIRTIEGLEKNNTLHPVQKAWIKEDVAQCGYCQSGQIMAAVSLLEDTPNPTDEDINSITNLCRCATYSRIRKAIKRASKIINEGAS